MTPLPTARVPEAAGLLARAFDEDPYFRHLAPGANDRQRFLTGLMSSFLALAVPRMAAGAAFQEGQLRGICLWYGPGAYPAPALETARSYVATMGRDLASGRLSAKMLLRALRLGTLLDETHPAEPHFYLQVLGVDPRWQGRGTGSAMLQQRMAEADRARLPVLLETSKELNLRLYRRFGFEITRTTRCESSPPLWTMVRDPMPLS